MEIINIARPTGGQPIQILKTPTKPNFSVGDFFIFDSKLFSAKQVRFTQGTKTITFWSRLFSGISNLFTK